MSVYNKLHTQHEISAMQSSGVRILRIIGVFMQGGLFVAALHFMFLNSVVLTSTEKLRLWESQDFRQITPETNLTRYPAWFMVGDYMLYAEATNNTGDTLYNVKLIERDNTGLMTTYTTAEKATYTPDPLSATQRIWVFTNAERRTLATADTVPLPTFTTEIATTPSELAIFDKKLDEMTLSELRTLSKASKINNDRGYYYETWLHRRFSQPLGTLVMVLIAAPILFMRPRGANRIIAGFAIILFGFLFFVAERIALSGAESGNFPPVLMVWLPVYLFGGGVLAWTLWRESRFSRK